MNNLWKKTSVLLLLALFAVGDIFADLVSFVDLRDYGIMGGRNVSMRVSARGRQVTSYGVVSKVGVIFQAVATPGAGIAGKPVNLEYRANQPDGQRLIITIGDSVITADLYDWQMISTARFVATDYTASVSLLGRPMTQAEMAEFINSPGTIMFTEFHPQFINTLTGMNLFFIDAMLVDGNLNRMRQVTNTLNGVIPGYNDINIDERESTAGVAYIRSLILRQPVTWDSYIYTDYGTDVRYNIQGGKLTFNGFPSYLFMSIDDDTETVTVNDALNAMIRQNIQRIRAINPVIYRAAEQTAQWAAFFRMVKEQYPEVWNRFIVQIGDIQNELQIETPRAWRRN